MGAKISDKSRTNLDNVARIPKQARFMSVYSSKKCDQIFCWAASLGFWLKRTSKSSWFRRGFQKIGKSGITDTIARQNNVSAVVAPATCMHGALR